MAPATLMGATVKRKEDPRLIRGAGAYVADLKLPGMLHVALVRRPYAHARIRGIDASAARSMPGVVTVVTGRDMLAVCEPLPLASSGEGGESGGEVYTGRVRHVLAVERARHAGEAVAAVVAASYATALDAAQAIEVDYEPLPVVSDPLQALAPGAPLVFEGLPDNVDHRRRRQRGDVEAAFAAAHVVVRQRMRNSAWPASRWRGGPCWPPPIRLRVASRSTPAHRPPTRCGARWRWCCGSAKIRCG